MKFIRKVFAADGLQWTGDNLAEFTARPEVLHAEPQGSKLLIRTKAPRGFAQKEISTILRLSDWILIEHDGYVTPVSADALAMNYEGVK